MNLRIRVVITYGTFDLFHVGHLRLLKRLRALGDELYVGISTDEFNAIKGKTSVIAFEDRVEIVQGLRCVDMVFGEENWDQKPLDIAKYGAAIFGMGDDWAGKFDDLKALCDVIYLPRTEGISTTQIKAGLPITRFNSREE